MKCVVPNKRTGSSLGELLAECRKTIGAVEVMYRLYRCEELDGGPCYFVSVREASGRRELCVSRRTRAAAMALYRKVTVGAVSPCHFFDVVHDLGAASVKDAPIA